MPGMGDRAYSESDFNDIEEAKRETRRPLDVEQAKPEPNQLSAAFDHAVEELMKAALTCVSTHYTKEEAGARVRTLIRHELENSFHRLESKKK